MHLRYRPREYFSRGIPRRGCRDHPGRQLQPGFCVRQSHEAGQGRGSRGFAVSRACRTGKKIVPLFARDRAIAERVLDGPGAGIPGGGPFSIYRGTIPGLRRWLPTGGCGRPRALPGSIRRKIRCSHLWIRVTGSRPSSWREKKLKKKRTATVGLFIFFTPDGYRYLALLPLRWALPACRPD